MELNYTCSSMAQAKLAEYPPVYNLVHVLASFLAHQANQTLDFELGIMLMGIPQCQGICEIGILLMHINELKGYSDLKGRNVGLMDNAFCKPVCYMA